MGKRRTIEDRSDWPVIGHFDCPSCGAKAGEPCWLKRSVDNPTPTTTHRARLALVNTHQCCGKGPYAD